MNKPPFHTENFTDWRSSLVLHLINTNRSPFQSLVVFLGYLKVILSRLTKQKDSLPIRSFPIPVTSHQGRSLASWCQGSCAWAPWLCQELLLPCGVAGSCCCGLGLISSGPMGMKRGTCLPFQQKWSQPVFNFSAANSQGLWLLRASQGKAQRCLGSAGFGGLTTMEMFSFLH